MRISRSEAARSLEDFSLEAQDVMGLAVEMQINYGFAPALEGKTVSDVELQFKDQQDVHDSNRSYMRALDIVPLTTHQIEASLLDRNTPPLLEQIEPFRQRANSVASTIIKPSLITEDLPTEAWADVVFNEVTFGEKETVFAGFRTFFSTYRNKRVIDSGFAFLDEVTNYVLSPEFVDPTDNRSGIGHTIRLRKTPSLALSGFESHDFLREYEEEMLESMRIAAQNKGACYMAMSGKPENPEEELINLQLEQAVVDCNTEIAAITTALERVRKYL